jgi:O-antigen/teichoic acid export membrane protein
MSNKRLLQDTILYGIAMGINRGGLLLFLPLLTAFLSVENFGLYALVYALGSFLLPLLSANGSSAIMRDGAENSTKGQHLFSIYFIISLVWGAIIAIIIYFFDTSQAYWLSLSVLFGTANALYELLLTWIRVRDQIAKFFLLSVLRTCSILFVLLLAQYYTLGISLLLAVQSLLILIIAVIFSTQDICTFYTKDYDKNTYQDMLPSMRFAAWLIPHNVAQWLMNSSDKMIIKLLLTSTLLGTYSFSYTVGSVIILINSGISLALPQHIIKNIDTWRDGRIKNKGIALYSILALITYGLLLTFWHILLSYIPQNYTGQPIVQDIIFYVFSGFYVMGIYYFYGNFLFYTKKTKILSSITVICSLFNLILTVVLCYQIGVLGAAIATFLTYCIYTLLTIYYANKYFNTIQSSILLDILIVSATLILLYSIKTFFIYFNLL